MSERALSGAPAVGWHGKLPSRGDFVSGGARSALLEGWRAWTVSSLKAVVSGGAAAMNAFLTAPLWRFACLPGFFAPSGGIGVIGPGADRLGRLFPFAVAAEMAELNDPARALAAAGEWFSTVEPAILAALKPDFDPVGLGALLVRPPALEPMPMPAGAPRAVFVAQGRVRRRLCADGQPTEALFASLFGLREPGPASVDDRRSAP